MNPDLKNIKIREELIQFQKGALDRFVINTKHQIQEKPNEELNENLVENSEEILEDDNLNSQENDEGCEDNLGNENNEDVNKKEEINLENIYDPAH